MLILRPLLCVAALSLAFAAILILLEVPPKQASARFFRTDLMPNGIVNDCSNCHSNKFGGGPRTKFGEDVNLRVTPNGHEEFWNEALAMKDSDEDGFTNGEELQDPGGVWRPGQPAPGDRSLVTNPGDPDDFPEPPPERPLFHRGDPDESGDSDLTDAIFIFNHLFLGDEPPQCLESADVTNDGQLDLSDGIALLNWLFLGGAPPGPPGPPEEDCGTDPDVPGSAGDLGCSTYAICDS